MYLKAYERWLQEAQEDKEVALELQKIQSDDEAIKDRFYRDLSFGTGGLRGIIGAGTNRMNVYTVKKASQGLSLYLNEEFETPSIAIAYDSRKNSSLFAQAAAEVFAKNGIKVNIFAELMPTPMLSFAVRFLKASAGIVITASHNPAAYNGYKVYGSDGCQITLKAAEAITRHIASVDIFKDVRSEKYAALSGKDMIRIIPDDTIEAYFNAVLRQSVYDVPRSELKVVYSPLNGTGNKPVQRILKNIGVADVSVVPAQENPDSSFATCPYPNPEEEQALALAIQMAKEKRADIVLATDPDCDRVGAAVKHADKYVLINGNQMGVLLFEFLCKMKKKSSKMPENAMAIKTIVTSEMAQAIADAYGIELINVLTGFKFIGEQIGLLEEKGEADRFVFGFEESYGYLAGSYVRDKDAVVASMLICQMATYYREQGKTLIDVLEDLYRKYGYYFEKLESYLFDGIGGMQDMQTLMNTLRKNPPVTIGEMKVKAVCDYLLSKRYEQGNISFIQLPSSDVMGFFFANGSSVVVRPSGTEPKLKIYYSIKSEDKPGAVKSYEKIQKAMKAIIAR